MGITKLMKLRRATADAALKRADRKRPGNFARNAVLVSILVGASFGCMRNDTNTPPEGAETGKYHFSAYVRSQTVKEGNSVTAEVWQETNGRDDVKKVSLEAFPGDVVFFTSRCEFGTGEFIPVSDNTKARVTIVNYRLKVRGIDMAGVEFELQEERFVGIMAAKELGIKLTPEEIMRLSNKRSEEMLAIFRVSFDGTKTPSITKLEDLGLQDLRVEPAGGNKTRVSYVQSCDGEQ